jgi:hypothetical protein
MNFTEFISARDAAGSISPHLAIISAERNDRPKRLNRVHHQLLAKDIDHTGFQFLSIKTNEEKSYLIMAGAITANSFLEYIVHWLNKYEQEYALVRLANSDEAWKILPTGNRYKYGMWSKDIQPNLPL